MKATYHRHMLHFKQPSGTSRGVLKTKETWFLVIHHEGKQGIGECGILRGLSVDDRPGYEEKLKWTCEHISLGLEQLWEALMEWPSIQFGVEIAFKSLASDDQFTLFPTDFTQGITSIPINGLIWMGDASFMSSQIEAKLAQGFKCLKMKIGAIDVVKELSLLRGIRKEYSEEQVTLRVDANGAFTLRAAQDILNELAILNIHSIEQPLPVNRRQEMAALCKESAIPIALDEELIGISSLAEKRRLLEQVAPQYIILKPSFIGGFKGSQEWIDLANEMDIGWWVTSALESNIGLNAIAQWTYTLQVEGYQGLGTGSLFTNNIKAPLEVSDGTLRYNSQKKWEFNY